MSHSLPQRVGFATQLARAWIAASRERRGLEEDLSGVRSFCSFVGYPRSGHSVVAALLEAHPNAVIAHEEGALQYAGLHFGRERIFARLVANSRDIGHTRGHSGVRAGGYTYDVPGWWQGRYERLDVIGDKHGEDTARRLAADPRLLERFERVIAVPVHWMHVVRNPFDNVATIARRGSRGGAPDVAAAAAHYIALGRSVTALTLRIPPTRFHHLRHESFVREPAVELAGLCRVLGLEPRSDYLAACAAAVFVTPHRTRNEVDWPDEVRAELERWIATTPFLTGYSFDAD